MKLITKKDVEALDTIRAENCVSIFIPTHRAGEGVNDGKDALKLKNELKAIRHKLSASMGPVEVDKWVAPVQDLLNDTGFWRQRSDGLALFLCDGFFKKFTLPVYFEQFHYMGNSFYLKPLMPMFTGDGTYYVLALEQNYVKLYEQTRHSITDVEIDDLVPASLQDKVGHDYEPKNLQYRGLGDSQGRAMYHGHAEADRGRQSEIARYFRAIDKGLKTLLRDETAPMILATHDYLYPIYQRENTYAHLSEDFISTSPSNVNKFDLHEMAWDKVAPIFNRERVEKIKEFKEHEGSGKTSSSISHVLPKALGGQVEVLFVENRMDLWGVYNSETNEVRVDEKSTPNNECLLNRAAITTFLNGGSVYLLEKDEMPNSHSRVNALYRY
ncbi:hypothetical protein RQM65_02010 [Pricia sp. S334]|uniref:Uncharacterized protein n=1 Tax=Pricia mediterranea TaxID=3076079 RepID=A0ABU3L151_9FLAO|nr:hypothetical protein [Pricia sp. S334]MDT7827437.1 hypothetical protein [Pricia sp. S334]